MGLVRIMGTATLLCLLASCLYPTEFSGLAFVLPTTLTTTRNNQIALDRSHWGLHGSRKSSPTIHHVTSSKNSGSNEEPSLEHVPGPEDTSEETIRSLFVLFNNALATGVPKIVAKRYAKDAVLLPSTNGEPLMDVQAIEGFYAEYLQQKPQKRILEGRIRIGYGWSEDAGICEISVQDPVAGIARKLKARYSFVYVWEGHQWKILQHHSSILGAVEATPCGAPSVSSGPMTTQRVENLFQLLQDALEIRDADAVARRFVHNGLLMPLEVYEAPKKGHTEIHDYMEEFLLGRPVISNVSRVQVTIDPSIPGHQMWAKDLGTFEITFKKDGSSLHARYALDYVLDDDGIWKISQFVVSPLPHDWDRLRATRKATPAIPQPMVSPPRSLQVEDSDVGGESASGKHDQSGLRNQPGLPPKATEEEVRGWFSEWSEAMATGDPQVVANRYSPQAVMMSTMSRTPRTTPQEIYEYYQLFLWNRPQAKAIESFVTVSTHWCKDMGVLEYAMRNNEGRLQRIKERYSFLYVYDEAGGWKIAHHQSSVMPQGLQETSGALKESPDDDDNRFFQ